MTKTRRKALAVPALGFAGLLAIASPAAAEEHENVRGADLTPVPLNGAPVEDAFVLVEVASSTTLRGFVVGARGLAPGAHAAHIHFDADAAHSCPTEASDANGDGIITTPEGAPAYGPIVFSLTTEGDTSPDSALALERFGQGSQFEYSRVGPDAVVPQRDEILVSEEVVAAILANQAVVVIHGVDVNGNGVYDGPPSELDPEVPREATLPALCGVLTPETMGPEPEPTPTTTPAPTATATPIATPAPTATSAPQVTAKPRGGVQTGSGSTDGIESAGFLGLGTLGLLTGAVLLRRRLSDNRG